MEAYFGRCLDVGVFCFLAVLFVCLGTLLGRETCLLLGCVLQENKETLKTYEYKVQEENMLEVGFSKTHKKIFMTINKVGFCFGCVVCMNL